MADAPVNLKQLYPGSQRQREKYLRLGRHWKPLFPVFKEHVGFGEMAEGSVNGLVFYSLVIHSLVKHQLH